ncbi:hypothetical protein [Endozoicomonas arenosclerae]|uniref:hypothetical protein n=1 Tax=Endozoicomonas arenosclerae TaxID=1633495 RepID=UPI000785CFE2|nr:hypothetical protein [Endozoicomonas arenosclerae]
MKWIVVLVVILSMLGTGISANTHLYAVEHHEHHGMHTHFSDAADYLADTGYDQSGGYEHTHFSLMALLYESSPELQAMNNVYASAYQPALTSLQYAPPIPPPTRSQFLA